MAYNFKGQNDAEIEYEASCGTWFAIYDDYGNLCSLMKYDEDATDMALVMLRKEVKRILESRSRYLDSGDSLSKYTIEAMFLPNMGDVVKNYQKMNK